MGKIQDVLKEYREVTRKIMTANRVIPRIKAMLTYLETSKRAIKFLGVEESIINNAIDSVKSLVSELEAKRNELKEKYKELVGD